jgi:uncharacterized membrane protein
MAKVEATAHSRHIEETIRSIDELHAKHKQQATPLQRAIDGLTAVIARPSFVILLTVAVAGWIGSNLLATQFGHQAMDRPPFPWLEGWISLVSLYLVVIILATQRHEDGLAQRRELLLLELAILAEQKITKVIQLMEEGRRDNPLVPNRVDQEAEDMSQPSDPKSVLNVIRDKQEAPAKT